MSTPDPFSGAGDLGLDTITVSSGNPDNLNFPVPTDIGQPDLSNWGIQPINFNPSTLPLPSSDFSQFSSGGGSAPQTGLLQSAINAFTGGTGLAGLAKLAPEAAVAAYGLSQAKSAQAEAASQANELKAASAPFLAESQNLLSQFNNQKLTPSQQQYVDFTSQEGQNLIDSGGALKQIASQAFGDYQAGKLPAAQQLELDQQTASQKQQVAQQMSSAGIADSSILDAYNQQIDNQAMITKQKLLDQRFATGDQAYNSWLNSTTQGIQVKSLGAQFAQQSFQSMMTDALGLEGAGMAGLTSAIGLTIQSDNELSQAVSQLMGNLAAAYAYTVSGPGNSPIIAGGGGGYGGTSFGGEVSQSAGGGILGSLLGTAANATASSLISQGINAAFAGGAAGAGGAASTGAGITAGQVAGAIAAPLAAWNEYKTWQSGNTGSDALGGAETGASIGTAIMPGIGTAVGAGIGALAGAASSAFGPGKEDPENVGWNNYAAAFAQNPAAVQGGTPSQNFQSLAGIFDSRGSKIPFYNAYGRMGENRFMNDMSSVVNSAISSGKVPPNASPQQIYSAVVQPWITSMSPGGWPDTSTVKGVPEKQAVGNLITNIIAQWQQGAQFTGIAGQQVTMSPYGGGGGQAAPASAPAARGTVAQRASSGRAAWQMR